MASSTSSAPRGFSRRAREREILAATRRLFDERGVQDAPIEEIARQVGINKALIYRQFASKEELFILTLTSYLADLAAVLADVDRERDPRTQLEQCWLRFTDFCLAHPAFLDCSLSLMRGPARELRESVSDAVWFRLGQGMAQCLGNLSRILALGAAQGAFTVPDPDFAANRLYTQTLGTMHLARIGVGVREGPAGIAETFRIEPREVQEACVADALASVGADPAR